MSAWTNEINFEFTLIWLSQSKNSKVDFLAKLAKEIESMNDNQVMIKIFTYQVL